METLLNETEFTQQITPHLTYSPDSANYALYLIFLDLLISGGGDDDFATENPNKIAFAFSKNVTLSHIEQYDNDQELEVYHQLKSQYLKQ